MSLRNQTPATIIGWSLATIAGCAALAAVGFLVLCAWTIIQKMAS